VDFGPAVLARGSDAVFLWTYLLALSSLDYARPNFLRVLRLIGLEYIALTFIADFIVLPTHTLQHPVQYLPFSIMIGVGPVLRLAALMRRAFALRSVPIAELADREAAEALTCRLIKDLATSTLCSVAARLVATYDIPDYGTYGRRLPSAQGLKRGT
jgi:hypothetical protein